MLQDKLHIILKESEEIEVLNGRPWVYSNEVHSFKGPISSGCICEVDDYNGNFIGQGFYNSSSKIMVRMLTFDNCLIDKNFFKDRIMNAILYRKQLNIFECCRLVYSEADLLPGLVVDKYGEYLCLQFTSLGMDYLKQDIVNILVTLLHPIGIYERSDSLIREKEGLKPLKGFLYNEFNPRVEVVENGIHFIVDMENGQKTGYFLDQKYNRDSLKNFVSGKLVLDCFCNTGGFSLNAAKHQAKKVMAVDISQKAIDDVLLNASLNNFTQIETKCMDVFDFLRDDSNKDIYDVIVLDPPAFTKTKETVEKAYKGYKEINTSALKLIKKNGILFTFSCSQHMTLDLFLQMLKEAKVDSKRTVQFLSLSIQSLDHPVLLEEDASLYLKCAVLRVLD